jgi:hypothetical protein
LRLGLWTGEFTATRVGFATPPFRLHQPAARGLRKLHQGDVTSSRYLIFRHSSPDKSVTFRASN